MHTINVTDGSVHVPQSAVVLCCASFEERSATFPTSLRARTDLTLLLFANEESFRDTAEKRAILSSMFPGRLRVVRIRKRNPLFTADALTHELKSIDDSKDICIDISTFTREAIFLIIRIIDDLGVFSRVRFFYTRARAYSIGSNPGEEWLSKGVNTVRSVLGYPGDLTPGRPLHLIVLPGVEFDRAMRLCEEFEPNHISIGIGVGNRPVDKREKDKVEAVSERMKQYNSSCGTFNFSTVDAVETAIRVREMAEATPGYNVIVAAMSNKISTVGAALAGIANNEIQLAYAEPIEYNKDNYSTPDDVMIHFGLSRTASGGFAYRS